MRSRYGLDSFKIVISQKTIVYWSIGTDGNNEKKKGQHSDFLL